jgi:hypothetical protein
MKAKCRICGKVQNVVLRKRTDDIRGAAITGVACRGSGIDTVS